MRVFILIWFGQLVSLVGSSLTSFALGVWVYQTRGSVTQYSIISLSAILPYILVSPFAGAVADRWNRRLVMIVSDFLAGLCTLSIALLFAGGNIQIWHICLLSALNSAFSALQYPAFTASITLLVSRNDLERASGFTQAGRAVSRLMVAPILAGALLETIGLWGILLLDFATFLFAFTILLLVKIPDVETSDAGKKGKGTLAREATYGLSYIVHQPGLLALLVFIAVANFFVGLAYVLFTPLILSFASAAVLGAIASVGGGGMLIGSVGLGLWGETKNLINAMFGYSIMIGICIVSAGWHSNIFFLGVAVFFFFFGRTIIAGCTQVVIQKKVEPDIQGRVFAITGSIVAACLPLAYFAAGPLADYLFEPLMQSGGMYADTIGQFIETGAGAGIRLMFNIIGASIILIAIVGFLYPPLRRLEDKNPEELSERKNPPAAV